AGSGRRRPAGPARPPDPPPPGSTAVPGRPPRSWPRPARGTPTAAGWPVAGAPPGRPRRGRRRGVSRRPPRAGPSGRRGGTAGPSGGQLNPPVRVANDAERRPCRCRFPPAAPGYGGRVPPGPVIAARPRAPAASPPVSVVLMTHNRRESLLRVLERMVALPEQPPVIVVDNASSDGTRDAVLRDFPQVTLVACEANLGAVARNLGVERVRTPYVAFCDDDTWWEPGSLAAAARLLDLHPPVASITARILVEPDGREDPITPELRDSPVPAPPGLPGPALMSLLAGASVLRVDAFRQVGGFSPRLWLGGEEEL